MQFNPPPLPANGHLLAELGYLEEPKAAIAIDLAPQTLVEYRKRGIGPAYTTIARTVWYSVDSLKAWLERGGTRAFEQDEPAPAPAATKSKAKRRARVAA